MTGEQLALFPAPPRTTRPASAVPRRQPPPASLRRRGRYRRIHTIHVIGDLL